MVSYKLRLIEKDKLKKNKLYEINHITNLISVRDDLSKNTKLYLIYRGKLILRFKKSRNIFDFFKINTLPIFYYPTGFFRTIFRKYNLFDFKNKDFKINNKNKQY